MNELVRRPVVASLAKEISEAHTQFLEGMTTTLNAGIKVGELLIEAKQNMEHGEFLPWIAESLPFTERTAQKYMKIARKQDEVETKGAKLLSEAYNAIKENKKPDYKKIYSEYETNIDDEDSFNEIEDNFMSIKTEQVLKPKEKIETKEENLHFYWNDLQKLISGMNYMYRRLSAQRNSQTPRFVGYMIGNIKDMADRLETWDPEVLKDCPECKGTNSIPMEDMHGDIDQIECPFCINGKIGSFKETKY
jgi:hypothetical protein